MASVGYSGKPLYSKLSIKPEMKIMLFNQPDNYYSLIETSVHAQLCTKNEIPDFIHLFVKTEKEFVVEMDKLKTHLYKKYFPYPLGFLDKEACPSTSSG